MTAKQYQAALDKHGLSQVYWGTLMGVDPRTSRRWALGEVRIPGSVAILLKLLDAETITLADILQAGRRS